MSRSASNVVNALIAASLRDHRGPDPSRAHAACGPGSDGRLPASHRRWRQPLAIDVGADLAAGGATVGLAVDGASLRSSISSPRPDAVDALTRQVSLAAHAADR